MVIPHISPDDGVRGSLENIGLYLKKVEKYFSLNSTAVIITPTVSLPNQHNSDINTFYFQHSVSHFWEVQDQVTSTLQGLLLIYACGVF
jgi:hypothetical protein